MSARFFGYDEFFVGMGIVLLSLPCLTGTLFFGLRYMFSKKTCFPILGIRIAGAFILV